MPTDFDFESRFVPVLLAFAKERGLDPEALVAQVGLPRLALQLTPGKELFTARASQISALVDAVSNALNDPHVGLTVASWVPRGSYGVVEFVVRATSTLQQGFEQFVRYGAILAPGQSISFTVDEREGRTDHRTTLGASAVGRQFNEYMTGIFVRTMRSMAPAARPSRLWFATPRPESTSRLTAIFGDVPFEFDQPGNGFAVPAEFLSLPVQGGDPALHAYLDEHARVALASRPKQDDLVDKLRHALREAVAQGEPHIERVAVRLNTSARTLQRRLSELQTSFQQVLDEVRFDLAREYLRDVRLDLGQIAWLLGYSELRAFDRAFRRWANEVAPGEWRASRR